MARKPAAPPKGEPANAVARAAQEAARALTKRISHDTQCVGYVEMGLRDLFNHYRDTANANLPHGMRITRLDVDLEYGVNHQDPATMVERNTELNQPTRDLANGVLHIAINGAEPQLINITLFQTPFEATDGTSLVMLVGNRGSDQTEPYAFSLQVDEKDPKSFLPVHNALGVPVSMIGRSKTMISLTDFIGAKVREMMVNTRKPALIAQQRPAA